MRRFHFNGLTLSALALVLAFAQAGRSQSQQPQPSLPRSAPSLAGNPNGFNSTWGSQPQSAPSTQGMTCKIYALNDLGDDLNLSKWVADTIQQAIEPGSWSAQGGAGTLSYYAPNRIMVVNQSPAMHARVEGFIADLRKTLPAGKAQTATAACTGCCELDTIVKQMQGTPANVRTVINMPVSSPAPKVAPVQQAVAMPQVFRVAGHTEGTSYPVPQAAKQPKHLFHFIIRYEGDGVIDSSVVDFAKAMQEKVSGKDDSNASAGPVTGAAIGAAMSVLSAPQFATPGCAAPSALPACTVPGPCAPLPPIGPNSPYATMPAPLTMPPAMPQAPTGTAPRQMPRADQGWPQ